MIELLMMAGGLAIAGTLAYVFHQSQSEGRSNRWREAADQLGRDVVSHDQGGSHRLVGAFDGVRFSARLRTEHRNKTTYEYCDVTATVGMPLPPGLSVHKKSFTEQLGSFFTRSTRGRKPIVEFGSLQVRCGDERAGRALFARSDVMRWLRRSADVAKQFGVISNQVTMGGFEAKDTGSIVGAVKTAVASVHELERAMTWMPGREGKLPLAGRQMVAFGVEAPPAAPATEEVGVPAPDDAKGAAPKLLERMMSNLAADGVVDDDAGQFTIDREAALRKLRSSRVDRSSTFALELLRAAALRKATRIAVRHDADDFEIEFDGEPFSRRDLEDAFGAAFSSSSDPTVQARRHLALGLEGALGYTPKWLELRGPRAGIRREPEQADVFDDGNASLETTTVHLKFGLGDRLRGRNFEVPAELIVEHARFMNAQVTVNGTPVESGPPRERLWGQIDIEAEGPTAPIRGAVGFVTHDRHGRAAQAWLGRHQVWTERRELDLAPVQLRVVVMAQDLQTDLSGQRLVDDDDMQRVLAVVDPLVARSVVELATDLGRARKRNDVRTPAVAWLVRQLCMQLLDWETLRHAASLEYGTAAHALVTAKCWPAFDERFRSLRDLNRNLGGEPVPFVDFGFRVAAAAYGRSGQERLHAALDRTLPGHAIDVSHLDGDERRWIASVFGSRLRNETRSFLTTAKQG